MIINADVLDWAKNYTGPKFHALLSDPPYHLTRPTAGGPSGEGTEHRGHRFAGLDRGFMGREWDGVGPDGIGIAFRPETWAALAQHLYPGAWGMAFSGSRGWHRMAVAIEDAGLIIQPTMFGWGYGSGFPKATRIDTQIDAAAFRAWLDLHPEERDRLKAVRELERAARRAKDAEATNEARSELRALTAAYKAAAGLAPRVVGKGINHDAKMRHAAKHASGGNGVTYLEAPEGPWITEAATEAARYWLGHRYGGQAIKPALEPIIVFQKPYSRAGAVADMLATGAGALWIDGARIGTDEDLNGGAYSGGEANHMWSANSGGGGLQRQPGQFQQPAGRWPANLLLSHAADCGDACAPGCPVAALGAQSGESVSKAGGSSGWAFSVNIPGAERNDPRGGHDDTGTAARFFHQSDYMLERLELADAIAYYAKASRAEREAGLDPRQTAIMRLLDDGEDGIEDFEDRSKHIVYAGDRHAIGRCPHHNEAMDSATRKATYKCGCTVERRAQFAETTVDDGRETPIDNPYQRGETTRRNIHPTIKPIALSRHLATLLLPPPEYGPRRLLIPFAGAGSEVIGADLAGWEEVVGIELEAPHVAIAEARRAYWQQRRWELGDPARKLSVKAAPKTPAGQLDLFAPEEAA